MTTTIELDGRDYIVQCEGDDDGLTILSVAEIIDGRHVEVIGLLTDSEMDSIVEMVGDQTGYSMSRRERMGWMRARIADVD